MCKLQAQLILLRAVEVGAVASAKAENFRECQGAKVTSEGLSQEAARHTAVPAVKSPPELTH